MKSSMLLLVLCAAAAVQSAQAQDLSAIRAACADDAQKLCAGVQPGGGRIVACLKQHKDALSDRCKQAAGVAAGSANSPAPSAATAPPAGTDNSGAAASAPVSTSGSSAPANPAKSSAASASKSSHSSSTAPGSGAAAHPDSGGYLRMKQVQIIAPVVDPSLGNGKDPVNLPVLDLLVPSTWEFKSNVAFNTTSGCIADSFSVSWEAKSADGSTAFQGAPDASWQYADDPAALHNLTDPSRRQINAQGKPCPVKKAMKAEEYFRQNVFTVFPSGSTVVSVDPFPELNEIARKQLGLAGDSKAGESQTEAIRARVEFQKDGKAMEDWVALVVVTRTFRQGRGAFYDCHAIDIMALRAEKGKLDASDKLFKVMISSLRPEAKWQAYSNHWIAWRYQVEAKKNAQIDAMIAAFQNHVAQTLNEVTANAQQGSMNSAFAFDQNIRGVQTFRDPNDRKHDGTE